MKIYNKLFIIKILIASCLFFVAEIGAANINIFDLDVPRTTVIKDWLDAKIDPDFIANAVMLSCFGYRNCDHYVYSGMKFLLENSAVNPEKIVLFHPTTSLDLGRLLIKYGMTANKFLDLTLISDLEKSKKEEFIEFILKENVNLDIIKYPFVHEALINNQKLPFRKQGIIGNKLVSFWKKDLSEFYCTHAEQSASKTEFDYKGFCHGIVLLWLCACELQFKYPELHPKYTKDWFDNTVTDIVNWDKEVELNDATISNFINFSFLILKLQNTKSKDDRQLYLHEFVNNGIFDLDGKFIEKSFCYPKTNVTLEQLKKLLKEATSSGSITWLGVLTREEHHALGVFKNSNYYYFYDPNDDFGEYRDTSLERIAEIIFYRYGKFTRVNYDKPEQEVINITIQSYNIVEGRRFFESYIENFYSYFKRC